MRKLAVLDIDETLMEWDQSLTVSPRSCVYEFLDYLSEFDGLDLALFTTGHTSYAMWIRDHYFKQYRFVRALGEEFVQFHEGQKVKNLSLFMDRYDLRNIVLVDDKPRNARLQPDNYIEVKPPIHYRAKNQFDDELLKTGRRVKRFLKL